MRWLQGSLLVVAVLFVASSAFGETILFDDNFDSGTVGVAPDDPAVGTWSFSGDSMLTTDAASPGPASSPNYFSVNRSATWNDAKAQFTARQTTGTDLVRVEFDYFISEANGVDAIGYIALFDQGNIGEFQYIQPRGNGAVSSGGGALSGLVVDTWQHWTIDYNPGATTMDITIGSTLNDDISGYATPAGIDAVSLSATTTYGPFYFDNVEVSIVPEPSSVALLLSGLLGLVAYAWRKRK